MEGRRHGGKSEVQYISSVDIEDKCGDGRLTL
jgi:hypothetical protein